jgi:PTS system nitrogen regulatory IIA component
LAPHSSGADHLRALAQVSRTFRNGDLRQKLRNATGQDELKGLLCPKTLEATAA